MSDTGNRKSMDDVLASIRRIVKSEKEGDVADTTSLTESGSAVEDAVMADEPARAPDPVIDEPVGDAPLALTPDMRSDNSDDVASGQMDTPASGVAAAVDGEALEETVRRVLREEIANGALGKDLILSVLTEELTTGQTGNNISVNVMKLIQSEVAKALAK